VNFSNIRKDLGVSQAEIAILFGVSAASIRNWEQCIRDPESAAITLYKLVEEQDKDILVSMVSVACQRRYSELKDIQTLKRLITKVIKNKLLRSLFEVILLKSNSHWKPEELGFRVIKIQF
jgi:transcriptional regulator with XRE-family HTH domain